MRDQPSTERRHDQVYAAVREMVVANRLAPRLHIRIETLADTLRVSNTPVREALIRLASEGFIDEIPNSGFFAKELTEAGQRSLLRLGGMLIDWSLSLARPGGLPGLQKPPRLFESAAVLPPSGAIELMDALLERIALQSSNPEVVRTMSNILARTAFVRLVHCEFVASTPTLVAELCRTYAALDVAQLRSDLKRYQRGLLARLPDIIVAINREGFDTSGDGPGEPSSEPDP